MGIRISMADGAAKCGRTDGGNRRLETIPGAAIDGKFVGRHG
jgi:hypothetical protein